ncbi:CATRA system-associated protein [Streptomyces spectabilis]|uniref:CATRA-Associated Small Protein domain-containing protein n=1 Tax=Streptomyces spectabilis TaxID=68270 RepID=A0A5P2XG67_STRST|nr:CATRA system-associated protein [Streptomyces spectabilis]MBB5102105.1 hypothetical protein [Streptomyces spectabilis]MCI3907155.1 hypothetical protein [Streptomyces spectabilis]QEV63913.1 hypothetical protein CP982_38770 [Streptomyces spectabilis]
MAETAAGNDFEEAARQAASALGRIVEWSMPATRWRAVVAAVEAVGQSWRAGDGERLRLAAARLALAGPRLVATRHEDDPLVPAPAEVHERSNVLITEILSRSRSDWPTSRAEGGDDRDGGGA